MSPRAADARGAYKPAGEHTLSLKEYNSPVKLFNQHCRRSGNGSRQKPRIARRILFNPGRNQGSVLLVRRAISGLSAWQGPVERRGKAVEFAVGTRGISQVNRGQHAESQRELAHIDRLNPHG